MTNHTPSSPRPKKFQQSQTKVKQMMIFAYDHQGIIMTDKVHVEKVSQQFIIMTLCKIYAENAQKLTSIAQGWADHSP
jgi:hypothetical protein